MSNSKFVYIAISLVCFCFLFACAMRRSEPLKQREFTSTSEEVKRGEQVFMMYCDKCHPSGEAGLGPSINSNPAPQFIKRFQARHGLGVMPSFKKDEISRSDLHAMSKYLRKWKKY